MLLAPLCKTHNNVQPAVRPLCIPPGRSVYWQQCTCGGTKLLPRQRLMAECIDYEAGQHLLVVRPVYSILYTHRVRASYSIRNCYAEVRRGSHRR